MPQQKSHAQGSEARERVLHAAERLFAERGFAAITMRDIGKAAGIHHSSLYHHANGKEELFVEVMERLFHQHNAGLAEALAKAPPPVRAQLRAVADWFLAQSPIDIVRIAYADIPALPAATGAHLSSLAYTALIQPIEDVLIGAAQRGEIDHPMPGRIAGGILGLIQSVFAVPAQVVEHDPEARHTIAYDLLDALLQGLYPRRDESPSEEEKP